VLFLHNTAADPRQDPLPDDKHPRLLREKGFRGFPSLCFMDAEGNVLLQPPRSVEGFRATKTVIQLRAKGDKLTAPEQKELFLAEVRGNQIKREDVQPRADKLTLTDEEKALVASKLLEMEINEIFAKAREAGPEKTGEALVAILKAGKTPSEQNAMYWSGVLGHASKQKDAELAKRAYDVLMKRKDAPARQKERWKQMLDEATAQ
jgi:hypothetical protein